MPHGFDLVADGGIRLKVDDDECTVILGHLLASDVDLQGQRGSLQFST